MSADPFELQWANNNGRMMPAVRRRHGEGWVHVGYVLEVPDGEAIVKALNWHAGQAARDRDNICRELARDIADAIENFRSSR